MEFRIADTFTDSLGRLSGDEQKAVKTTAFDLQLNPASPSMQFHRLDRAKDRNFWSIRVSRDIRVIVHKTEASLLLCYVDHHDAAYSWAARRKIERHPKTGAAQLVEVRETIREITIPKVVEAEPDIVEQPALFVDVPDGDLLSYGVPQDWLADVHLATEDTLFEIAEHLPSEAAEALLDLATGATPQIAEEHPQDADPFTHPDAQRRFRVMANAEELARALDYPWEKWAVFLHPTQRQLVERNYGGPARVAGSAGTGKTIVALHRSVHLARSDRDARILLTTFSQTLANVLGVRLKQLIGNEPRILERIEIASMESIGIRLYEANFGPVSIASKDEVQDLLRDASSEVPEHRFSAQFLWAEWLNVVDAWQLRSWEEYRDVKRLGRKTRLAEPLRKVAWSIFEKVRSGLNGAGLLTHAEVLEKVTARFTESGRVPFEYAVIDEAQDVGVSELRFLAALGGGRPNSLFFAGDLGQRIFRQPFSWKALGVDIRGRSKTLRINYRTSHQIRRHADRLLAPVITDVDGNKEDRRNAVSVFNGPSPTVTVLDTKELEEAAVADWIKARLAEGVKPHEIAVFVRSHNQFPRAQSATNRAGVEASALDERMEAKRGAVSISTMHLAKGLEFRAVVVMACDDEIVPLQERIEVVTEDSDLQDVYETERHLLYVACTRARDHLLVTGVAPASEFLEDMQEKRF